LRTESCNQSNVEFSAKHAPNPSPLSSQRGWRTFHSRLFARYDFTGKSFSIMCLTPHGKHLRMG
jgi:hypothetical protein